MTVYGSPEYGPPPRQEHQEFQQYPDQPDPAAYPGYSGYPGWHEQGEEPPPAGGGFAGLLVPLLAGAMVAVVLGVYGGLHEGTGIAVNVAGFSGPLTAKVWLTTGAALFAVVQLISALVMYGKVPGLQPPQWIGGLHRWSGRIAFVLAIPVAIHCLYAIGFAVDSPRVLLHSLFGCVFFGAFVVKMLGLRKDGLAGWVLPVFGGLVFAMLVGLWLTSSLWYFTTFGIQR